jgi:PEGA domain-containing protein
VPPMKIRLERAVGTIVVKGPEGAKIRVGDVDKGKAPAKIDVDAGPQTITLTLNGKQVLQDLIEVEANQEVVVRGKEVAEANPPPVDPPGPRDPAEPPGPDVKKRGSASPRGPNDKIVAVTGVIDIGFRNFTYQNPKIDNDPMTLDDLSNENEGGQVIAGPMIELWPGTIAGVRFLRGFALVARLELPVNKQPVTGGRIMGTTTTFWQYLEISARQRWSFSAGSFEANGGFVRDQHEFNASAMDKQFVPDADYKSIKLGVRGSLRIGALEPYAAVENRVVLSGGDAFKKRFTLGATATGLHGALGATRKLGPFQACVEGSYTRYSWTFKPDTTDTFKADGASDSIFLISAGLGYAY